MRKTFQLRPEGKHPDRVLEAVKHEIRKYIKRERRRVLPEGVDFWDFDCRFGATQETAQVVHLAALTGLMDTVAKAVGPQFYVEILVKHGHRAAKPAVAATSGDDAAA
jgi:predicted N-acyltransferase